MTDMNYKNKLMGLSLILLAAFSACTDDVENGGRDSGTDDHRITLPWARNPPMPGHGRTAAFRMPPDHTRPIPWRCRASWTAKNVYLTAEVSDGLPG